MDIQLPTGFLQEIEEILKSRFIDINYIKEAFEQSIIETYIGIRIRNGLPCCDTVYSTNKNIRKNYVQYDPKYHIRMSLISEKLYHILNRSILSGTLDEFSNPYSYNNKKKYINANIEMNFQLTDTLFSDSELEYINSVEPAF